MSWSSSAEADVDALQQKVEADVLGRVVGAAQ